VTAVPDDVATRESPPLAPHECRIWWATIDDGGRHLEALLSEAERERSRAYVQADDRARFEIGAALLRRSAAGCASPPPDRLWVERGCPACGAQHGKPRLPDHPELDVSVAHSGRHVAVALAHGPRIGVDVERIRQDVDVEELARSAFASEEAAELTALPPGERATAFFRLWTRKESIVKALGVGITDGFASVSATMAGASEHELACPTGYVAALAIIGRCDHIDTLDAAALLRGAAPCGQRPRPRMRRG
jgi:4'-phosphopantetheinyl transferase